MKLGLKSGPRPSKTLIEQVLEGVPLPARRSDLVKHAKSEGERGVAKALKSLPGRRYSSIDEVGEALEPVQPKRPRKPSVPQAESDLPPGGADYGRP